MCLKSVNDKPSIADEDMVCYKLIYFDDHQWVSICQVERFPFGDLQAKGLKNIKSNQNHLYKISSGYFHAYTTYPKAYLEYVLIDGNFRILNFPIVIVKCIIPKGSMYYLSWDGMEICSDKIIILKENIL